MVDVDGQHGNLLPIVDGVASLARGNDGSPGALAQLAKCADDPLGRHGVLVDCGQRR